MLPIVACVWPRSANDLAAESVVWRLRLWRLSAYVLPPVFLLIAGAADWPQLQGNPQRTGWTPDEPKAPFALRWHVELDRERISSLVQPIVLGSRTYLGTRVGVVHAYDIETGKEVWQHKTHGPILHALAGEGGLVFAASLDGHVHALKAEDGTLAWKADCGYPGFSTAPCLAEGKLLIGGRNGIFYCIQQSDGKLLWQYTTGAPIFTTAAYDQGVVFCGNEGMRVFALDVQTGRRLWESEKLWGHSLDWYWPVVHKKKVLVHTWMNILGANLYEDDWARLSQVLKERAIIASWPWAPSPEYKEKSLAVADWLKSHPAFRSSYVLDAQTGQEPYVPSVVYNTANTGSMFPPIVGRDGYIYTPITGPGGRYSAAPAAYGRLSVEDGLIECQVPSPVEPTMDEQNGYSVGGNTIFAVHCHPIWGYLANPGDARARPATLSLNTLLHRGPGAKGHYKRDGIAGISAPAISGNKVVISYRDFLYVWEGT